MLGNVCNATVSVKNDCLISQMIQLIQLCNIYYKNCFTLPMLPINSYFHSVCLVSMSLCYNICFEKETQLLFGQSYMFGDVIIWYVQ